MFKRNPLLQKLTAYNTAAPFLANICYACNGLVDERHSPRMASYSASIGYGITTAAAGIILTCSRILDGITDPLFAFVYDRVNTKFGKLRILMVAGFLIEALALRNVHRLLVQSWGCRCLPCCTLFTSSAQPSPHDRRPSPPS
ncbi:MAG: MFS transporter [Faecalibacterium sp.]